MDKSTIIFFNGLFTVYFRTFFTKPMVNISLFMMWNVVRSNKNRNILSIIMLLSRALHTTQTADSQVDFSWTDVFVADWILIESTHTLNWCDSKNEYIQRITLIQKKANKKQQCSTKHTQAKKSKQIDSLRTDDMIKCTCAGNAPTLDGRTLHSIHSPLSP